MAEETTANADPSMEEILASIRKIISDDSPPPAEAAPAAETAVEPPAPPFAPPASAAAMPLAASVSHEEDIVELTQMVQDDGSVVDLNAPAPAPEPSPVIIAPVPPPPIMASAPTPTESLVSEPAASTAASALSSLASTLEIERLAHSPSGATYLGNGSRTLEDMVIELMRPLLKGWLDENLPPIVERLVQKEIERISRRS